MFIFKWIIMKKIIVIPVILILGTLAYSFLVGNQTEQARYLTESVTRGNIEKTVVASGSISSVNEVDVGAQVSGKITKLYVALGQDVKKGELIADIDSTTQLNNLNTKKAALASYQAQLKAKETALSVAQSAYSRYAELYAKKAASLDDFNNAKNNFDAAQAETNALKESIKQAEIEVSTAETNLGYTKITSPIDGTIISTPIAEGQTVNSVQTAPTIVKVADLSKMRVKPEISEGDITKVKAGQAVRFTILSDPNTHYESVISSVDPATTTKSDNSSSSSSSSSSSASSSTSAVYYYANLIVDNPDRTLRIGMTTENNIKIADAQNVLLVPNMAIQKKDGKTFVNLLNANNQPELREVEVGVQNDFQAEIKRGLTEGDRVIVSQVAAGEKVGNNGRGPRIF